MKTAYQIGHGEVRISSARSNSSKWAIALQPHGQVFRYDMAGGGPPYELSHEVRSDTQPVFSRYSPDHIFTINGHQIWQHDLRNDGLELVASFPQYISLSAEHAEGDLTTDGWLALCGLDESNVRHTFCYNLHTKESSDVHQFGRNEYIDGLKAAYGGWLLVSNDRGIHAHPRVGISYPVAPANGHAATAVYQGRPKLLWFSNARPDPWRNTVEMIDIEHPSDVRVLMDMGRDNYAGHVSAGPDAAYISLYDPDGNLPFQIWRAPYSTEANELLYEWYGPYNNLYTPRASYSDGMVLFNKWTGQECDVLGFRVDGVVAPAPSPTPPITTIPVGLPGYFEVNLSTEPDASYFVELPVKDGKAVPWRMFKKNT